MHACSVVLVGAGGNSADWHLSAEYSTYQQQGSECGGLGCHVWTSGMQGFARVILLMTGLLTPLPSTIARPLLGIAAAAWTLLRQCAASKPVLSNLVACWLVKASQR